MAMTIRKLNKKLKALHPELTIYKGAGYFYFERSGSGEVPQSIYVYTLNEISESQWDDSLKSAVEEIE